MKLFLSVYINDIGKLPLIGTSRLFADDTAIFYPKASANVIVDDIEYDLRLLIDYFNLNLLSLNLSKTKYMIFHLVRKKIEVHRNPMSEQHEIEKVKHFKYLGVLLDSTVLGLSHQRS